MGLLRLNKDATVSKLTLALFTEDLADNKELGARVAHLEAELAGVALAQGRKQEALHALVAAAGAHRVLGQLTQALSCLKRAALLEAGDAETEKLLQEAMADLDARLHRAAPLAKAPAKKAEKPKAEKKPEPKPEPKAEPEPKVEEAPAEEPEAEPAAEAPAEEAPAEEPKAEEVPAPKKKKARKCGVCGEEGHDARTCEKTQEELP